MLSAEASSAICVQRFDGSRNSAIHTTYRISLRSSSLREPRYPLLRVISVWMHWLGQIHIWFQSMRFGLVLVFDGGPTHKATEAAKRVQPDWCLTPIELHQNRQLSQFQRTEQEWFTVLVLIDSMILPQVHLRKPCYDFSFL